MKLTVTNSVMGIGSIASVVLFNYAESWAVFYAAWTILFSFGLVVTLALDFDAWIHSRKESQECNTLRAALEMSEKVRATILEQYHAELENNGALQRELNRSGLKLSSAIAGAYEGEDPRLQQVSLMSQRLADLELQQEKKEAPCLGELMQRELARKPYNYEGALIEITGCSDKVRWYAKHVGKKFPLTGIFSDTNEYRTRQPEGYTNFVLMQDARIVEGETNADQLAGANVSTNQPLERVANA